VAYLISNIPQFKCWVRKEFTANHMDYHGEYLHGLAIAVNTLPDRSLYLTDAGEYTGNFVALPNNRVRATNPALWRVGEGAPDFMPSQWTHSAEQHESYIDPNITFNNLYNEE
jgi:hypothetical protein